MRTPIILLALASSAAAVQPPLHLRWADLAVVTGRQVSIATSAGVVRGKAISVDSDALVVKSKGKPVRVPRAGLRRFEMQTKGVKYRIVGTSLCGVAGAAGGVAAGIAIQGGLFEDNNRGKSVTAAVGITAVGAAAGYFLGNAADKRWTPVEILD